MKKKNIKKNTRGRQGTSYREGASAPTPTSSAGTQNCSHFYKRKCGGCSFLHIPYQEQLLAKRQSVVNILNSSFRPLPDRIRPEAKDLVQQVVPSPNPMGFRASAKFCLHENRDGRKVIGLYMQGSRVVVDTAGCPANVGLANEVLHKMFAKRSFLPAKFYDHQGRVFQKNRLKFLTIRTSPASGKTPGNAAVIITHTGVDKHAMAKWLNLAGLGDICVYESRLTKSDGDNFTGRFIDPVSGPLTFPYLLNDQVFHISPASFFQANHSLAAELIKCTTDFKTDGRILLDLYGGFGAYSFAVKSRFKEILAVDGNKAAITAANAHAEGIGATHLKAFADTCEHFLEERLPAETALNITHMIVNPSRAGMSQRVLKQLDPKKLPSLRELHYVSCNPATFARDARVLLELGYRLNCLVPFDMFPQSDHVEVVGKFFAESGN